MKKLEELEQAINAYVDNSDKETLTKFVGKCKGLEPFGEKDLGMYINEGDFVNVDKILNKITTFAEKSPYFDITIKILNKLDKLGKESGANKFRRVLSYIAKRLQEGKSLRTVPEKLRNANITQNEWDIMVSLMR